MSALPKSLHTVRILVAVARDRLGFSGGGLRADLALAAILYSAKVCGYPEADHRDPLIVKAAAQLAGGAA